MDNRAIGVFDSGVGGLTVLRELINKLPNESFIYYGDTARTPYGMKSQNTILNFSRQIINFLMSQDVKLIVIACNTVSANCYEQLKFEFDIPMIEMVSNGVKACRDVTNNNTIGIIGTEATISSKVYEMKLHEMKVYAKSCPLLVPLAEEGWTENEIAEQIVNVYMKSFEVTDIDTLLLACTHYPLFEKLIAKSLPRVRIVNPAMETSLAAEKLLGERKREIENEKTNVVLITSDDSRKFISIANNILPNASNKIFLVNKLD